MVKSQGVPPLKSVWVKQHASFIFPPRWLVGEASLPATTQNHQHLGGVKTQIGPHYHGIELIPGSL